jgi:DNA-binding response OmpR family regulator
MSQSALRRVLFVEDEPGLRHAYQRYFGRRYKVAFSATGAEAITQVDRFDPDVVVLDLKLPDTDGVDLLRTIRGHHADLPVVVTTSYASMQPLMDLLGIDHSGYLVKPFELKELASRIDAAG